MKILTQIEYAISAAALLLLVGYHAYYYWKVRTAPLSTSLGLSRQTRNLWVQSVMTGGKDILAIQTLRNWTMAATFLASTSILIGLGIFNLAVTADKQGELSLLLTQFKNIHPGFWLAKLVLLGIDFLFAFFNFTLAIRYYNHTGFLINLPLGPLPDRDIALVTETLDRGGVHYTLGMRGYYLAIPLALWLFGPLWMLGGSLLMIVVLNRLDRII